MKRDEERHSPEPQELGIASVETKGLGWQAPEALIGFFSRRRAPGHRSLHPL